MTGNLEAHSIIEPIRKFCHRTSSENVSFFEAKAVDVDVENNTVHCHSKTIFICFDFSKKKRKMKKLEKILNLKLIMII